LLCRQFSNKVFDSLINRSRKSYSLEITRAQKKAKDAERALNEDRRKAMKREQRHILEEKRITKAREWDSVNAKKASDKAEREAERLNKRQKKLEQQLLHEKS